MDRLPPTVKTRRRLALPNFGWSFAELGCYTPFPCPNSALISSISFVSRRPYST